MAAEANLQTRILRSLERAQAAGCPVYFVKNHGSIYQRRGVPDVSIIYQGRAAVVELKSATGTTTRQQDMELMAAALAGAVIAVIDSWPDWLEWWAGFTMPLEAFLWHSAALGGQG